MNKNKLVSARKIKRKKKTEKNKFKLKKKKNSQNVCIGWRLATDPFLQSGSPWIYLRKLMSLIISLFIEDQGGGVRIL